ncbi:MAG: ATP-dependent acyl-CoA ligase [Deltaproteobacteria bacterium]|jgi:crotonobetaine/carnitine-CoA ligase|nr:MAG: ATP-dependent acyl-CoA ligase [Deltaproteobacteria bacterium]
MPKDIDMKIERKKPFNPEWYLKEKRENWVLPLILKDRAEKFPERPFLQYQNERPLTFKEVNTLANKIANGLIELGIKKGDRVAVLLPNSADYVLIWFGILKAGGIMAPVNTAYKMDFLQYIIDNSDSKVLFVADEYLDRIAPIQDRIPQVEKIVVWTKDGSKDFQNKGVNLKSLIPYREFLDNSSPKEPDVEVRFIDIARLMYTSGTTGRSKGVTKSHAADYYSARGYVEITETRKNDVLFTCLPLFHSNAQVLCVYPALIAGAKVVIYERFSASQFWHWIKESGATLFNSLGAMSYFLWRQPPVPEEKEHRVRLALISPAPHDMLKDFMKRFNLKILEGYGLTETGVVTYMRPNEPFRIGSCGKEAPGYEVKIVDPETDEELPRGKVGEIVVRPRIPNIMLYYYHKMPEKTVQDFRNFWFHTGDAGRMDKDGYVYFVDRVKDYIRRRGENISSFEVEKIVCQHPAVLEAAAVGIKSGEGKFAEDEVMVVIVKKPGQDVTPEEIIKHCEERMPYFMIPRFVRFVDSLPKTPTERVQKHILKEQGVTADTWDMQKAGYKIKR